MDLVNKIAAEQKKRIDDVLKLFPGGTYSIYQGKRHRFSVENLKQTPFYKVLTGDIGKEFGPNNHYGVGLWEKQSRAKNPITYRDRILSEIKNYNIKRESKTLQDDKRR